MHETLYMHMYKRRKKKTAELMTHSRMKHTRIHGIMDIPEYIHSKQFSSQPPDGHLLVEITLSSHGEFKL